MNGRQAIIEIRETLEAAAEYLWAEDRLRHLQNGESGRDVPPSPLSRRVKQAAVLARQLDVIMVTASLELTEATKET